MVGKKAGENGDTREDNYLMCLREKRAKSGSVAGQTTGDFTEDEHDSVLVSDRNDM